MSRQGFWRFMRSTGEALPAGPWHPLAAVLAALVIVALGQIVPAALVYVYFVTDASGPGSVSPEDVRAVLSGKGTALLLAAQASMALAILLLAGRRGSSAKATLLLVPPRSGADAFIYAAVVMAAVVALTNGLTYAFSPESFTSDFEQFKDLILGPEPWMVFAAIAIGAPLWEEMLFRGFLLPPLAGRLGFWPAAGLVSAGWAALHVGYSVFGLLEVFVIGLLFAWLMRQTRSLLVPMVCHATYNGLLFLLLRQYS